MMLRAERHQKRRSAAYISCRRIGKRERNESFYQHRQRSINRGYTCAVEHTAQLRIAADDIKRVAVRLSVVDDHRQIEVFFRTVKNKLVFDKYRIRSAFGVRRFWLMMSLAYNLARLESDTYDFNDGCKKL